MKINSFEKKADCLLLHTDNGKIRIQPMAKNIFRITYTLLEEFKQGKSMMRVPLNVSDAKFSVDENEESIKVFTTCIQIIISKHTAAFSYLDSKGNTLVKEPDRGGKTLIPIDVVKSVFDESAEINTAKGVDGLRFSVDNYTRIIDRKAYSTKLEFVWGEGEAIYGLGSHEEGIMNLRGHHQYLYQQNYKAVVPAFVSTKGYGILVDSYSLMTFRDDVYGSYFWSEINDEMDYYFIYGPEFDQLVSGFRKLTGKVPMLPRWAFGYVQSKERYKSQEELIFVVKEYRKRKIPLDLIVLDWQSWTGDLWGQKTFDPERFPDPTSMMDQLHGLDAKLMVSIWPIMRKGGDNHREMKENGFLLGNQGTYDAFNKKARELYWKQANDGIFSHNIDAWWCDCTEPFEADWSGEHRLEPEKRLEVNSGEAKKYLDPAYINAYSLQHSKGIFEGQQAVTRDKRVVNLTRSAYAGQQRYSTITWSGDISANWETLRKQIPGGLNFCVTGLPYWTLDIGAFFVNNREQWFWSGDYDEGCEDLGYRELYVRWFQQGVFLPMFRSHGTDTPREVWRFGEPGSQTYDTLVKFDKLRYRLLPYIYSLAGMVTLEDYTMMRVLPFDFRQDVKTYDISGQYMFGPVFMVTPITAPMYYKSDSRPLQDTEKSKQVYLPEGCTWYDFWTGNAFKGGQTITTEAPLDIMPLFVRSGSILPMGPDIQHTSEKMEAAIELRIYPGSDGSFTIYEDEGDNYNYETGAFATTNIKWDDKNRLLVFEDRIGSFPGMVSERDYNIVIVAKAHGTGHEASNPNIIVHYNGNKQEVILS